MKKIKAFFHCLFLIIPVLLFQQCVSSNQFAEDAVIHQEITEAANNYNSENWEIRVKSVKSVSKYAGTVYAGNSLPLLLQAMDDSHSEVRIEALKILKNMEAPDAEDRIGGIALSDENSNVRYFAFSALAEYGNIKNEDIFINGIDNKDWLVREAALRGLMKIKDQDIQLKYLDVIINAVKDPNTSVKLTAISNLNIKNPLIYNQLSKIINDKESGLSILKAALGKIKGYKLDSKTKKRIIELLTHRDKNVRLLSLQVLKQDELKPDL